MSTNVTGPGIVDLAVIAKAFARQARSIRRLRALVDGYKRREALTATQAARVGVTSERAALAHEKDRARRVVRVFWRVRVAGSVDCSSWNERADAWAYKRRACPSGKVYMVTVRRMKRKVKR